MGAYTPDEMLVVLGFTIQIDNAGTGDDPDSAWETCTGGALNIEIADASTGKDQSHQTTPGHKYIDTLTLRGPMTSAREALCKWITETVAGQPWKRKVIIKEILKDGSDGKTFTYHDCFPTRYVFPALSAAGTGNLYEEVDMKPIRLDLA